MLQKERLRRAHVRPASVIRGHGDVGWRFLASEAVTRVRAGSPYRPSYLAALRSRSADEPCRRYLRVVAHAATGAGARRRALFVASSPAPGRARSSPAALEFCRRWPGPGQKSAHAWRTAIREDSPDGSGAAVRRVRAPAGLTARRRRSEAPLTTPEAMRALPARRPRARAGPEIRRAVAARSGRRPAPGTRRRSPAARSPAASPRTADVALGRHGGCRAALRCSLTPGLPGHRALAATGPAVSDRQPSARRARHDPAAFRRRRRLRHR